MTIRTRAMNTQPAPVRFPISVPKKYRERILHWDDERKGGNSIIISLKDGWCFDEQGCHVFGEDNVKDVIASMGRSLPCECADCTKALAKNCLP